MRPSMDPLPRSSSGAAGPGPETGATWIFIVEAAACIATTVLMWAFRPKRAGGATILVSICWI